MANGIKPTKNQHFIPQMYLRGFSEIKKSGKALIWQYNLNTMQQTPVQVDVQDICFEKHLYEIKSSDGSFVAQNTIEKAFGKIETNVSRVIRSIQIKSKNENCLNCSTILSEDDKSYLIIFITSLLYRTPETIEAGISLLKKTNPEMDTRDARNFTLFNLLPLGIDTEWDKNTIIRTAIEELSGMAFQIGITDDDVIITSDRPVVLWPPKEDDQYGRPQAVALPLTSRLLLYLFPVESVDPIAKNCFIKLTPNYINDFCSSLSVYAKNWIYSRNALTKNQLKIIKEARKRLGITEMESNEILK